MKRVYAKDPELNLFHRAKFDGIVYSDGDEAERRIHEAVVNATDRGTFSIELARAISDWPSEYHLSRHRHCLIRPLEIEPGDKVLELGCGCGAITRFLGELGAEVTAVEGGLQRARIAAERCRDLPNVKVVADDLLQFKTDERFDWVLLVGVLEYAPVFSSEMDPAGHYLHKVRPLLSQRGRLVVAIENKLGLKYFNGCAEDHLGIPFYGVQGLYGANTPRTFGRRELETHIKAAGLDHVEFLYPFPDYKLPHVVLTEAALSDHGFDPADLLAFAHARDYGGNPLRLFDEALVWREAARNGLLGELSNSFLVVASQQSARRAREALAIAYSTQRIAEFAIQTRFVRAGKSIRVIKEPLGPGPRQLTLKDGAVLENTPGESAYVQGRLSIWRLWEARARRADLPQIVDALAPWCDLLFSLATAPPARGGAAGGPGRGLADFTLPGRYLDFTPFNLMETGDQLVPIDAEWTIDRDIPLGWVITRAVQHSLLGTAGFESRAIKIVDVIAALCSRQGLDVSEENIVAWLHQESEMQDAVSGCHFPAHSVSATSKRQVLPHELLVERDRQIASLGQTVAERDQEIAVQASQLEKIFQSTGWRLLAPLRWYGRLRQLVRSTVEHQERILETRKSDIADQPLAPAHSDGHIYRGSLVIPTKNGGDLFKRVVDGLRAQTCWNNIEFIVIDSGSTDETISVARSAGAIVHTIPPNEFNHGATRDYGISLASNDYVVLMVQDAIPYDRFLIERLIAALSEEGVAGAYARQIPQRTADIITKRNLDSWLTGGLERKVKVMESLDWYERLSPTEKYLFCNFDNVCSAINKRMWKQEQFGRIAFGEDIDWAERVLKRKFKIVYEPTAVVVHSHSRSLSYEYKRNYICHRLLYRRFGLQLVPSLRGIWRAWLGSSASDMLLAVRMEKGITQKLLMLLTIPVGNLLAAIAQYRAVQDEIRGIKRNVQDV